MSFVSREGGEDVSFVVWRNRGVEEVFRSFLVCLRMNTTFCVCLTWVLGEGVSSLSCILQSRYTVVKYHLEFICPRELNNGAVLGNFQLQPRSSHPFTYPTTQSTRLDTDLD
jgi:hypothetical protein